MAKKNNVLTIDFNVWCTQQQRAHAAEMPLNTLSQQVKRALEGKPTPLKTTDIWPIYQLGITLVKRID